MAVTIVVAAFTGLALFTHEPADEAASDVDNAVMVDLPPAEAASQPASDAAEGPEQQAAQAVPAQPAPPQEEPQLQPPPEPTPQPTPEPAETPPLPPAPDPAAVLERQAEVVPPQPVAAPPTPPQEERAPTGSDTPVIAKETESSDEGRPHASKHAITLWQRSLMRRLEAAKRLIGHAPHAAGTASVAFRIDARGALASERVASTSGSAALDRAALALVREAAPFPAPPPGSGEKETYFVVPIRFR